MVSFLLQESLVLCSLFLSFPIPLCPVSSCPACFVSFCPISFALVIEPSTYRRVCWATSQSSSYFRKILTQDAITLFRLRLNLNPPALASLEAGASDLCHPSWLCVFLFLFLFFKRNYLLDHIIPFPWGDSWRYHWQGPQRGENQTWFSLTFYKTSRLWCQGGLSKVYLNTIESGKTFPGHNYSHSRCK